MTKFEQYAPPIALIVVLLFFTLGLCAQEMPKWVYAEVTAYCPCAKCCGTHDKITANMTNTDAVPYNFASDKSLPFGTRIYVPLGLGILDNARKNERVFIVDDRGGTLDVESKKYGKLRLDLRVKEHWWAVQFGRQTIPVYISK